MGSAGVTTRPATETQAVHVIYPKHEDVQPPVVTEEEDTVETGEYGIYVGNWGGRRRLPAVRHHLVWDVIIKSPASVLMAQEADPEFAAALDDPAAWMVKYRSQQAHQAPPALAGRADNPTPWLVVRGDEGEAIHCPAPTLIGQSSSPAVAGGSDPYRPNYVQGWSTNLSNSKSCLTAVRTTMARHLGILQWTKHFDGVYRKDGKERRAYTRLLVCEILWHRPQGGHSRCVVMNVHWHYKTARKVSVSLQAPSSIH